MNERAKAKMMLLKAQFEEWLAATSRTLRTRETYERGVRQFIEWLAAHTSINNIGEVLPKHLQQYQIEIYTNGNEATKPLSIAAQQLRLTIVRQFFSWLVLTQQLAFNPATTIVLPKVARRLPEVLSQKEIKRLLNALPTKTAADLRDRAILELLYSTAIRRAELLALKIYDIDLVAATITIEKGKGNSKRRLPLIGNTKEILFNYLQEVRAKLASAASEELLFISTRSGGKLTGNDIGRIVAKAAKKAGIDKRVTAHTLRHSCATHLLAEQADIRYIQKLLGHQKLSTTEIYTQVEISDLRSVLERCHPRAK